MKQIGLVALIGTACLAFSFVWAVFSELPKLGTVAPPFLQEVNGKEQMAEGKPLLVNFFYTKCPDVCPFTTRDLKKLQKELKEKGVTEDQYSIIFVTLDPEHDTVETILKYKEGFDISSSNWLFFRGSEEETRKYASQFNMVYKRNEDGSVTHSMFMYLVDSNRQIRARHEMSAESKKVDTGKIAEHLLTLVK